MSLWTKVKKAIKSVLSLGAKPRQLINRQRDKMKQEFGDTIRQATVSQSPVSAVLNGVRSAVESVKRNTTTIILTAANSAANVAREVVIDANKDQFRGYVHASILDNRTSFVCIGRSGLKWRLDKSPVGHKKPYQRPPLHHRCRSKIVPWLKGANVELPQSYPKWLKGQPKDVQIEVLGPARYKMWKKGNLSLRQLVDQSGRPLTLEELRNG